MVKKKKKVAKKAPKRAPKRVAKKAKKKAVRKPSKALPPTVSIAQLLERVAAELTAEMDPAGRREIVLTVKNRATKARKKARKGGR